MKTIGIIPSRYASSRLPGKPLMDIHGKSMIRRVYEQCLKAKKLDKVLVATDDERIQKEVLDFGGEVVMTSQNHQSGTDRCNEALLKQGNDYDIVVNIQGDEPFISPNQIDLIVGCFENDNTTEIATLIKKVVDIETLQDPNKVSVVCDYKGFALYFSRQLIPFLRGVPPSDWTTQHNYYKHIGMYAYKANVLSNLSELPQSNLEMAEKLEQLRWLENGFKIKTAITEEEAISIDTPEDLSRLLKLKQ